MPKSDQFRQLLLADMALVMEVVEAHEVAAALTRYWEQRESPECSLAGELIRVAKLGPDALEPVEQAVDKLIVDACGDAHTALTRHGGLDRSIHVALSRSAAPVSMALTEVGAGARAPLATIRPDRYIDFLPAGEGGMGFVYMAIDTELNRTVAFKMVRPDGGAGSMPDGGLTPVEMTRPEDGSQASRIFEELKARFLQEAWVTGGLEHPGIVPVHELGQTAAGIPYYTMRLVRGGRTLKDALDEDRVAPVADRLHLLEPFLKLCDAVSYAHSRGVTHRDLKPDNVALGDFGEAVLLDWGLAKLEGREDIAASRWQERVQEFREAGDLQTVAGALGTPGYMAPEAATGRIEQVDAKSDVYSLGVILFEILTGRLPFEITTYPEYLDCMMHKEAPKARTLCADLPSVLEALCSDCLSRDRTRRPQDVRALAEAIRSWQAASALEREVEGLLRDARGALDAAAGAAAGERLRHIDRAAAALHQVETKQGDPPGLGELRARADGLREQGIREREKISGRRLLVRIGVAALVLATVASFVVAAMIDKQRDETKTALDENRKLAGHYEQLMQLTVERDLKLREAQEAAIAGASSGAEVQTLDLRLAIAASPSRVLAGDSFSVNVTVRNTGDVALSDVILALRGSEGVAQVGSDALMDTIKRLAPGQDLSLTRWFKSDTPGEHSVSASARVKPGWAASGAVCPIIVVGAASEVVLERAVGRTRDLEVTCTLPGNATWLVGDPFVVTATVRNAGDLALDDVVFAVLGGDGVLPVGDQQLKVKITRLEAGESRQLRRTFVSHDRGERRILTSARDAAGWAAAGAFQPVLIREVPSFGMAMTSVGIDGKPKDAFEPGDRILYRLSVENGSSTALTPDLKLLWQLPENLAFISGTGSHDVTINGGGRAAASSSFVMVPRQVMHFELTVRVVSVPDRKRTLMRASLVADAGRAEVATATEATTLRRPR